MAYRPTLRTSNVIAGAFGRRVGAFFLPKASTNEVAFDFPRKSPASAEFRFERDDSRTRILKVVVVPPSSDDAPTRTVAQAPGAFRVRAVTLHVARGPDQGRSARLDQPTFVIGVGEAADFRLTDPGISREHVRLTLTPAGVRIRDGGSKNGTFLGTSRIHDLTVTNDTAIVIGGTTLAIAIAAEAMDLRDSREPD